MWFMISAAVSCELEKDRTFERRIKNLNWFHPVHKDLFNFIKKVE